MRSTSMVSASSSKRLCSAKAKKLGMVHLQAPVGYITLIVGLHSYLVILYGPAAGKKLGI